MTGIVQMYDTDRGYGFIRPLIGKTNAPSVFFHISAIAGGKDKRGAGIPIGAEVSFDLVRGERGPQAANVRIRTLSGKALQSE